MRSEKKSGGRLLRPVLLFLLPLLFFSWRGVHGGGGPEERGRRVSVIVDSSQDSRWIAFQAGAERAAEDFRLSLNYVSTGKLLSLSDQAELIRKELEEGAEAIILQLCASDGSEEMLEEFAGRAEFVLVEAESSPAQAAGEESVPRFSSVTADDYALGEALGRAVLGNRRNDLRVGVITGNLAKTSMRRRKAGLEAVLQGAGKETVWDSGAMLNLDARIRTRQKRAEANTFVALDDEGLEAAVAYVQKHTEAQIAIYGAGHSDRNVYYLDQGAIRSMAVADSFNMGYQAAEEAAERLKNPFRQARQHRVEFKLVDRTNMFLPENEKLLFPLVE